MADMPPALLQSYAAEALVSPSPVAPAGARQAAALRTLHECVAATFARLRLPFLYIVNVSARATEVYLKTLK